MNKKWLGLALSAVVLSTAVYSAAAGVSAKLSTKDSPILFVPKTIDSRVEFWEVMKQGVFAAAKEYGVKVEVVGTVNESDVEEQITLFEQTITQKPKAIVMAATDYNRVVPVAKKIVQSGIKLITVDSGLEGGISSSFIATDNYAAGLKAGQSIQGSLPRDSSVAIISFVKGSTTAMERERGVRDSLKAAGISVFGTFYSNASEEKAYDIAKYLITNEPAIKGIIGLNEPSAVGAAKAVKELGATERVKMVGFDSSMNEIAFLEEGILLATVVQKPFNMGYLAIKAALQAVNGDKLESTIDTGSELITKENMYSKENQKLLFPFAEK
ncbi:substrate-binding domain-containing protein [Paenibacillus sp. UNC451MF]|uniref:substrate-binding domain-containing protein n=1 Tax=Paenibacillus sp. UNC451MF TaxID=1449063 RepID=UPI00048EBBA8|nr:substrate-binding domain-containing protein [Paenibacillus sp. UNC451MF]